jgi:acyl transferase domain-containing protein
VYRATLDACDEVLRGELERPLLEVMYAGEGEPQAALLDETCYTQPALFALEYALAAMWRSWGIEPAVVLGHSAGEYVAACVAGVFALEDALRLIAARGRLMQGLSRDGAMAAVFTEVSRVTELLAGHEAEVSVAALNTPGNVVISGRQEAVQTVCGQLEAQGVEWRALRIRVAAHSPLMEPMLEEFEALAEQVSYAEPRIPVVSNVTGELVTGREMSQAVYWREHVRRPVRFVDSMRRAEATGCGVYLEVGPGGTLLGLGCECLPDADLAWVQTLHKDREEWPQVLEALSQLWVNGVAVDWRGYEGEGVRRPVALPTYPFQRRRYWVEAAAAGANRRRRTGETAGTNTMRLIEEGHTQQLAQALEAETEFSSEEAAALPRLLKVLSERHRCEREAASIREWLYEVRWRLQPRRDSAAEVAGTWVLLADRGGVAEALAETLQARGTRVLRVYAGRADARADHGVCYVDPVEPEDFARVLARAADDETQPLAGVVHLWGLDATAPDATELETLAADERITCAAALHATQALMGLLADHRPRLWLVTRAAVSVGNNAAEVSLVPSMLWGLGKVVARESPEIWGGLIDLPPLPATNEARWLQAEIGSSEGEDLLAFREDRRYVARLVPARPKESRPPDIRPDATYLVTGGLGGLGLEVATWLVRQGARYLALVGRRGAASDAAREAVRALERSGARVHVAKGDVADEAAMREVFAELAAQLPPLRGVIHSAGVLEDSTLVHDDWDRFRRVLMPKVEGAWNLHDLTRDADLDFFVLFSSSAAMLGPAGQGNYAAANSFLDALAHHRRSLGLPGLSIGWGPWADVGMVPRQELEDRFTKQGVSLIGRDLGLEVLGLLLGTDVAQAAVTRVDWAKALRGAPGGPAFLREVANKAKVEPSPTMQTRPQDLQTRPRRAIRSVLSEAAPETRGELLLQYVRAVVAEALGHPDPDSLDVQASVLDFGFDSLMAVQVRNVFQRDAEMDLPLSLLLEGVSIDEIARHALSAIGTSTERTADAPEGPNEGPQASDELEAVLEKIDRLSEDESKSLLGTMIKPT